MRLAVIACAFVILVAGGCGDGDDDAGESAQTSPGAVGSTDSDESNALTVGEESTDDGDSDDAAGSDSGGEADSEQPPPSRAEYIRAADRICADASSDLAAVSREFRDLLQALQAGKINQDEYNERSGDLTAQFAEIGGHAIAELEALRRAATGEDALSGYFASTRRQTELLAEQADAQRDGDIRASAKLNKQLIREGKQTRAAAKQFGFHRCGQG